LTSKCVNKAHFCEIDWKYDFTAFLHVLVFISIICEEFLRYFVFYVSFSVFCGLSHVFLKSTGIYAKIILSNYVDQKNFSLMIFVSRFNVNLDINIFGYEICHYVFSKLQSYIIIFLNHQLKRSITKVLKLDIAKIIT